MTDIMAAIGLAQLSRYEELLEYRKDIIARYNKELMFRDDIHVLKHFTQDYKSSGHLYIVRLVGKDEKFRNEVISKDG